MPESEPALSPAQQRQREQMKAWRLAHPNYQREYIAKGGASALKIKVPLVERIKGQLPYPVTITKPLSKEERIHHETQPTTRTHEATGDDTEDPRLIGGPFGQARG